MIEQLAYLITSQAPHLVITRFHALFLSDIDDSRMILTHQKSLVESLHKQCEELDGLRVELREDSELQVSLKLAPGRFRRGT